MKKIKYLTLFVIIITKLNSQIASRCVQEPGSISTSTSECYFPPFSETHNVISNFVPNSNSPTLVYKVNFIFPYDPAQVNVYYYASMSTLYSGCTLTIANLNNYFNSLGNIPCWLPVLNPSPLVPNPKIQFVLNNVYKPASSLANNLAFWSNQTELNNLTYPNDNAITVIFCPYTFTTNLTGGADVPDRGLIRYHYTMGGPLYAGQDLGGPLLAHELAHAVAALPDHYTTNTVIPSSMPPPYNPLNQSLPTYGAYFADDSPNDILASYSCYTPTNPTNPYSNNNLMGNSFCREHLSAKQIASFHYLVAAGATSKYLQNSNFIYPPLFPNAPSTILSGNQTITNDIFFKKIIVPNGSTITVQNAKVLATDLDSKIIIEPGAILRLINVQVGSSLDLKWRGIEVWGNPYLPQTNANQGALVLLNSCISNAEKGILVGKTDNSGNLTGMHGGGIVESISSNFFNNINHVTFDFLSGVSVASSNNQNRSLFRQTTFKSEKKIYEKETSITFVELNNTRRLRFLSCQFDLVGLNPKNISVFGIKGNNSSLEIQPYAGGTAPAIQAYLFDHFIYLTNCFGNNLIQDNIIYGQKSIYISNGNYDKIVRNQFNIVNHPYNLTTNPRSAIYLDNCKNYKIENNYIFSFQKNNSYGIVVNNSGPYPNKIYNNQVVSTFFGIWCQNQNYDPNSLNYDGLVLNCNDFSNLDYNAGVMEFGGFNNTGIAKFQGDPTDPDNGTRNTYNSPSCGDENKFYIYAPISNPPQVQHYNYQNPQFRITPQPACSNFNEIIDISTIPAPPLKDLYCSNTSTLPAGRTFHTGQISLLQNTNNSLESAYNSNLDNGNTQNLLTLINSNASPGQVKNQLMAAPYLSDTVLISYFKKISTSPGHAKQVHEKNAPVSDKVWQTIVERNYPTGIFNQMQSEQNSSSTSPKDMAIGNKSIVKNNLSYEIMHKSMSILNDSTINLIDKRDSLSSLIQLNQTENQTRQLIELDINLGLFGQAREKIVNYINNATNLTEQQYGNFMLNYINILNNPTKMSNFNSSQPEYELINNAAHTENHPCNLTAKGLLNYYNKTFYNELYLTPNINSGSRFGKNQNESSEAFYNYQSDFIIFPNPANTKLFLKIKNSGLTKLMLYNVTGQIMVTKILDSKELEEFDVTHLPNGIYLVTLYNYNNELLKSKKLIIEH